MRTIKFRGLRVDGKGWVYGCLINNLWAHASDGSPVCEIIPNDTDFDAGDWSEVDEIAVAVLPETVGQYTEENDINNNEIYHRDIVKITDPYNHSSVVSEVLYRNGGFVIEANGFFNSGESDITTIGWAKEEDITIEVIDNSIQSPELIKQ